MNLLVASDVDTVDVDCDTHEAFEQLRQYALEELGLLDTPESESFDRITRMAVRLFGTSISAVSLTDRSRQWFKSHVGTTGREIPRNAAPCAEVTRSQSFLNVPDLLCDERFATCPLAEAGIRFYAGAPLTTRSGYTLGAMCILDSQPRTITPDQVSSLEDFAAMVMAQIELQHETGRIDATSGLPNRHQLYDDLADQTRKTPAAQRVLLLIEIVDLRHVNDAVSVLGASYLDALTKAAAVAIRSAFGQRTPLYQVGFASVALLLDETKGDVNTVMDALSVHLRAPSSANGIPVVINPVFGVSPLRLDEVSPQDALRTAVSAARQARQSQIDYAVYSVDNDEALRRRFHLLTYLGESLEHEQGLALVYQPRLDLQTGLCSGAEALLRWVHPVLGNVSPGEFIPLVEQTAFARPMTQWVLTTACRQIKKWQQEGLSIKLSVNVSARNLEEADFADLLAETIARFGIRPQEIELEFTESALIRFKTRVLAQLAAIRGMGVDLAIDDFGTGYSSFAYLREIPATTLKLDQSFMHSLATDKRDQSMVKSMIAMAKDMGYKVVAEGVETKEAFDLLRAYGCDEIQGYLISRPLPLQAFEQFVLNAMALPIRTG